MAGSFSDFLENELLDHVFGNAAYTAPATVYAAAFTVVPDDASGGTEATGSAYARVAITNNATNFPAASGGSKTNGTEILWPQASGGNWGNIVGVALYDASTGGNRLGWSDTASTTINDGDQLRIQAGQLTLTLT